MGTWTFDSWEHDTTNYSIFCGDCMHRFKIFTTILIFGISTAGTTVEAAPKSGASNIKADLSAPKQQKEAEVKRVKRRLKSYKDRGMDYAKDLWTQQNGSNNDEVRQKKSDALGYNLRNRTINKTKSLLSKSKNPRVSATLYKRLADLYDKQANAEQIIYPIGPRAKEYQKNLRRSISIRKKLLAKSRRWIRTDVVLFSLAENYAMLQDSKRAEVYYKRVVSNHRKSIFLSDALLALGNLRFKQKMFSGARNFYRQILSVHGTPLGAYAHYKIAWAFFNEGKEQSAQNSLIDAIRLSQKMSRRQKRRLDVEEEAVRDLVLFYAESGDPGKAKEFFERVVDKERAKEMRYMLARRYFSHDKHNSAYLVATRLLSDKPSDNYVGQLLMITLSISEKTKRRKSSVASAWKLSEWVLRIQKKHAGKKVDDEIDMILTDAEESIRRLCHRLHFDSQKRRKKGLWQLSKESYEIYFATYKKSKELPEMRYRYAALLFKLKLNPEAHKNTEILLAMVKPTHKRFKEALKLRIQTIEQANAKQRKILTSKKLIFAYDDYVKHYPKDKLAPEALFKAAKVARKSEGAGQAAIRYRLLAKAYPNHKLRNVAIQESLATLLEAKKWNLLAKESKLLIGVVSSANEKSTGKKLVKNGKVDRKEFNKSTVFKKLLNARNTAMIKIAEEFEAKKKYKKAQSAYLKFIDSRKNSTLRPLAYVRLASMTENKMRDYMQAIEYWDKIGQEYSNTRQGRNAELEQARIHEKIMQPKRAIANYINHALKGKSTKHRASLANAAVLLESVGDWNRAADTFLQLNKWLTEKKKTKEAFQAMEFSCKNRLLAASKKISEKVYARLYQCSNYLAKRMSGPNGVLWRVRAAWALEKSDKSEEAIAYWSHIVKDRRQLAKNKNLNIFLAMAKSKLLVARVKKFKQIRFDKSNENPNANITKKSQAMDRLEFFTKDIFKYGTRKYVKLARRALQVAYLDFGDTLLKSAFPSKASPADRKVLKQSFAQAAKQMQEKAKEYAAMAKSDKNAAKKDDPDTRSYPSLSRKEFVEYVERASKDSRDAEAYAKLAWHMFDKGKYGVARYIAGKWAAVIKKREPKAGSPYSPKAFKEFKQQLAIQMPEKDPLLLELQES